MESLNQLKPRLIDCEISLDASWVCLESREHDKQVLLPLECHSFLKWMDGTHTFEQIVSREFAEKSRLSLKTVVQALVRLNQEGFLVDKISEGIFGESTITHQVIDEKKSIFFRPLLAFPFLPHFRFAERGFEMFAGFLLTVQIFFAGVGMYDLLLGSGTLFLPSYLYDPDSGYQHAFLKFFFIGTAFLNFKYIYKYLVQMFGHAEIGRIELRLYPYGVCLAPSDFVVHRKASSFFKKLYFIASPLSFIGLIGFSRVAGLPAAVNPNDFLITGFFLSFLNSHPLHRSDFTDVLERFLPPQRLRHFIPYFKGKALLALVRRGAPIDGENVLVVFASIAFAWLLGFIYFLVSFSTQSLPLLLAGLASPSSVWKVMSPLVIAAFFVFVLLAVVKDLAVIFFTHTEDNFRKPLTGFFNLFLSRRVESGDKKEIANVLLSHWLFDGFFPEWIDSLLQSSVIRRYKPGASIVVQGDRSSEVYFLLSGNVKVILAESSGLEVQLAWLSSGAVFGESALLDGVKRTAHVRAVEDSEILVIPVSSFLKLFADSADSKKILERVALGQYLASSRVFAKLPQDALMSLSLEGGFKKMVKGSTLTSQNSPERDLYLILRGEAEVQVDGKVVKTLKQGSFFGEISLLTQTPRTASVIALTDVVVFKLSPESFFKIVARNPELGVDVENVAEERRDELQWLV